jgi:hypothetical protein
MMPDSWAPRGSLFAGKSLDRITKMNRINKMNLVNLVNLANPVNQL